MKNLSKSKKIDLLNEIEELAWKIEDIYHIKKEVKGIVHLARTLKAPLIT